RTLKPASSRIRFASGPDRSSRFPAAAESEIVMTSASPRAMNDLPIRAFLRQLAFPKAALTARLFQQSHRTYGNPFLDRFAHIVQRQRRNRRRGKRFHFNAGLAFGSRHRFDTSPSAGHFDRYIEVCQSQGMTKRNQLRGLLARLNACNTRDFN